MDKFRLGLACSVEVVSVRHVRSSQSLFIEGYTYTDHSALGRAYIRCRSEIPMISRKVRTLVKYGFRRWILSNIINIKEKFHTFTMIRRCHNIHSLSTTIYILFHRSDVGFDKILSRSMGWTKQQRQNLTLQLLIFMGLTWELTCLKWNICSPWWGTIFNISKRFLVS